MEKYILPDLPYEFSALEPHIDALTMQIHHDKHHASYIKNLNDALEKYLFEPDGSQSRRPNLLGKSPEDLVSDLESIPEEIRIIVKNNAGGHLNHTMFWQIMSPKGGGEPSGELAKEIKKYFGEFSDFQNKFNETGLKRFGSGWVWLVKTKSGSLDIISTANQDNPITEGHRIVLGNDVWEHAYYLKYKNMRADYLKAWWNVVNWEEAENRFKNS